MEAYLLQHEPWIRLSAFSLIFIVMAAWEVFAPRRVFAHPRRLRWAANLGIVALNSVLLRFLLPVAAILVCQTHKRSKTAAEHLTKAGFSNIKILRGGMEAWHRVTDRK